MENWKIEAKQEESWVWLLFSELIDAMVLTSWRASQN